MRLFFAGTARRLMGVAALLFFGLPLGMAVVGCGNKSTPVQYCSAGDAGPVVGQVAKIVLAPNFATVGESLNYGQIGASLSATASDCKGNSVSVRSYTYGSTSSFNSNATGGAVFADIDPRSGRVCGGTWNRNTGGGIPDFTTCTPPPAGQAAGFLAYVTATANGSVSNAIPVYVHPIVTGIELGQATGTKAGSVCPTATSAGSDPGTDCALCSPSTATTPVTTVAYDPAACLSQSKNARLVARVYSGGMTDAAHNITCQVGHITFATTTASIATIDETGVATANQPGSTVVTATVSNSSTATQAGFLSTCPPASIQLAVPGQPGVSSIDVALNNTQPLTTTILDTNGQPITGLALEFLSTSPQTIGAGAGAVTPLFPGTANVTAVCLPSSCNPAPFSQIGYLGNGKPVTSNPINVTAVGNSSTVIYMGSTQSQYVQPRDFTTNQPSALIKLPFVPNSMVINQTGTGVYLGSANGLMSFSTANKTLGNVNQSVPGVVLSVSPDGGTIVVTDPTRQTISLVTSSGGISSVYGGVGTEARWAPDSQTLYVTTTTNTVLVHQTFTDWQTANPLPAEKYTDVAVMAPHIGAYFAGAGSTDGRSYCSFTTPSNNLTPPDENNRFIPLADSKAVQTSRITATTDGVHILGAYANAAGVITVSDLDMNYPVIAPTAQPNGPGGCTTAQSQVVFPSTANTPDPVTGVVAAVNSSATPLTDPMAITGVVASSNSAAAFVTYTGTTTTGASPLLPFYAPPATGLGPLKTVPLLFGATTQASPVAGVFSTDNFSFYAGTSGGPNDSSPTDNAVHVITLTYPTGGVPTAADTAVITPNLPSAVNAGSAPVNLIVQRPKKSTS